MEDKKLQVMNAEVEMGADHLELVFTTAVAIPIGMTPQGPQVMPVPDNIYRVPMRKEVALEYVKKIQEAAENLADAPSPSAASNIVVANSLAGVENIAKADQQFRGRQ